MAGAPLSKVDLLVVARVLERLWREGEPMVLSRLQVGSNLSYDSCARYVAWLSERGLVVLGPSEDAHQRVAITPSGYKAYAKLAEWMEEFLGGGRRPPANP